MAIAVEIFSSEGWPEQVAARLDAALPASGSVVLTGGTTARRVYEVWDLDAGGLDLFFSDERCVPADHDESNYRMATSLLGVDAHRMKGEVDPEAAAAAYAQEIAPAVASGLDLLLLGMGADAHICALYPGSPALRATELCAAVDRPDGMMGLTLTPPAVVSAAKTFVLVTGDAKAEAVARVVNGDEPIEECPARLLASMDDVTLLLDEGAASALPE